MRLFLLVLIAMMTLFVGVAGCGRLSRYENRVWTIDCETNYADFSHMECDSAVVRYKGRSMSGILTNDDVVAKLRLSGKNEHITGNLNEIKIDSSTVVCQRKIENGSGLVSCRIGGRSAWVEEHPVGYLHSHDKKLYLVTPDSVMKISVSDSKRIWSVNAMVAGKSDERFPRTVLYPRAIYGGDSIYVENAVKDTFIKVKDEDGRVVGNNVSIPNGHEYLFGVYGDFPRMQDCHVDSLNRLVRKPSTVVCQLPEFPGTDFTRIVTLGSHILVMSYSSSNIPMKSGRKNINGAERSVFLEKFDDNGFGKTYTCRASLVSRLTNEVTELDTILGSPVIDVLPIRDGAIAYLADRAVCFDALMNKLFEFPYSRLDNPVRTGDARPKILWFDDKNLLVLDGDFLSCFSSR